MSKVRQPAKTSLLSRYRLVILASPLLALPVWDYAMRSDGLDGFVPTPGVVVSHVKLESNAGFPRYKSVIEYSAIDGQKMRLVDSIERRPPEAMGTAVKLLVDPNNPGSAVRAGMSGHWFSFSITTLLSLGFFLLAAAVTYFENRALNRRLARARQRHARARPIAS